MWNGVCKAYSGDVNHVRQQVAHNLRTLRQRQGLSLAALGQASGTGKATLSRLEAGQGNPTIETLFALADALGVSFGTLTAEPSASVQHVRAEDMVTITGAIEARVLTQISGAPLVEVLNIEFPVGIDRESRAHRQGIVEHILLTRGRLNAGPVGAEIELAAGDVLRFEADQEHRYQTLGSTPAQGIVLMTYPTHI